MKSMTGYGRCLLQENELELEIEIKSVNARFLDIRMYLPRDLSSYEYTIRQMLSERLSRGTVELRVNLTDLRPADLRLNVAKLHKYNELAILASQELDQNDKPSLEFLLSEPGVIENDSNLADDPVLDALLRKALNMALSNTLASMEAEGAQTAQVLADSMQRIHQEVMEIMPLIKPFKEELYKTMLTRIKELIQNGYLENIEQRITQEVAIYVDKYDIGEELSRLLAHYQTFIATLDKTGDIGKTLNFIIQEMQREANTLGSKFSTANSFPHILTIKEEIEKIREIVQNVA